MKVPGRRPDPAAPPAWSPDELQETLRAIRSGQVDAVVVASPLGDQVFTLEGADTPYRVLIEEMNEGAVTVSPEGTILYCNRCFADLMRTSLERVIGAAFDTFLAPGHASRFASLLRTARSGRSGGEVTGRALDGSLVPLKLSMSELPVAGTEVVCIVATDLSDSKMRERQLRQVQEELESRIVELARSNRDLMNSRAAALNMMEDAVEARQAVERTNEQIRREIAEREEAQAAVLQLEQQFRQAQKMEAIGKLAGGVAHDFNNILTAILGYSDLVLDKVDPASDIASDVGEIKAAGERAARLTQQLLAFSRKHMVVPRLTDLNDVIAGMEKMLRRVIGEDVQLSIALADTLDIVRVDPGLMEQVVLNLVVNARDAMPQGGSLTIATANYRIDEQFVVQHVGSQGGDHVAVSVRDTGCGMPPEVLDRIFEPFFTTKGLGKGTGLGLSTVYGIVKQSGGYIQVESAVGEGSTFTIYIPRAAGRPETADALAPTAVTLDGTETILVAEDEAFVRGLIRRALEPRGYSVLEAASAEEALAIEKLHEGDIDLLLTDIIMPDVNGPELAADLQRRRPAMKVLYITGFVDHAAVDLAELSQGGAFLQKPFSAEVLATRVRQQLGAPGRSAHP